MWKIIEKEEHPADTAGIPAYTYAVYRRRN
jgi:hypothetical protein